MTNFPTASEFRAWLETQPPRQVIAQNWGMSDCPLAKCVRERVPVADIASGAWWVGDRWQALPKYASQFVDQLENHDHLGRSITVRGCLAILRRVAPEAF